MFFDADIVIGHACFFHISQRLSRYWLRREEDEIDGMPLDQSITDFGIPFGASDTRAVSRIDNGY